MTLTQQQLMAEVHYDLESGRFTRLTARGGAKVGDECGYINALGYRYLSVGNREYQAHRLAWLWVHGEWPRQVIDHMNGNRADNRIVNLRDVSRLANQRNCKTHVSNTSGHRGVYWHKPTNNWTAMVFHKTKCISLGYFATKEAAIEARLAAEREHYGSDRCTLP